MKEYRKTEERKGSEGWSPLIFPVKKYGSINDDPLTKISEATWIFAVPVD